MQVQVSLTIEIAATANLCQMEEQIQAAGQQAMRAALKRAVHHWEAHREACPSCGAKQRRLEGTVRRALGTTFGRVEVARRRFRCHACGRRWCPAKELFADLKGGTISQCLQEAAILAGCSWPYRVASQLLKKLSGACISAEEMRLLTNQHGRQRATHQQAEADQVDAGPIQETKTAQNAEPPLLVGLDGGWVCSREQRGGMEGKVAVVCSQVEDLPLPPSSTTFSWSARRVPRRPPRQRHRLATRRYVATFAPASQMGKLTKAATRLVGGDTTRPVVLVADGARWIKTEQARHFPHATCILDWAHLWREVRQALRAVARAKPLSPRESAYQVSLQRSWLWQGEVEQALRGLRTLANGLPAEAGQRLQQTITYLEHQQPWIGSYAHWRQLGYPVGSGMIERAVTLVINRRMKKRGMRWRRENATAVVALRTDLLNEDWVIPQRLRAFP